MNGLRAAKYTVKALYLVIWISIVLMLVGPAAGFVGPLVAPQYQIGFGVDINSISSQFQFLGSNNPVGAHTISIPVYNNWFFPASATLTLTLIADGKVVYETDPGTISLSPFNSGNLHVTMTITQSLVTQLQGKQLQLGGRLTFGAPPQLWSFTMVFPQG